MTYAGRIQGVGNPKGADGKNATNTNDPATGAYMKITAKKNGKIEIPFYWNCSKALNFTDATDHQYVSGTLTTAEKVTTDAGDVEAGTVWETAFQTYKRGDMTETEKDGVTSKNPTNYVTFLNADLAAGHEYYFWLDGSKYSAYGIRYTVAGE